MKIVSGDKQSGPTGTLLPGQLVVNVLGPTGLAVAGVTVAFVVTSGSATLSASSAVTAANGQAAVGLTLGAASTENQRKRDRELTHLHRMPIGSARFWLLPQYESTANRFDLGLADIAFEHIARCEDVLGYESTALSEQLQD